MISVFIRKGFWEAVPMVTNVNTSHPPPPLRLLPPGFAAAPKAAEYGELGSLRGRLLREDRVDSAAHARKVRIPAVIVEKREARRDRGLELPPLPPDSLILPVSYPAKPAPSEMRRC